MRDMKNVKPVSHNFLTDTFVSVFFLTHRFIWSTIIYNWMYKSAYIFLYELKREWGAIPQRSRRCKDVVLCKYCHCFFGKAAIKCWYLSQNTCFYILFTAVTSDDCSVCFLPYFYLGLLSFAQNSLLCVFTL